MIAVLESLPGLAPLIPLGERSRTASQPRENPFEIDCCLRRVRKGDEDAARTLMEHLYPLVSKLVRAYLPRRTSEEDLIQTVYMKIFARLGQYSGLVPIEHWVSRITVNTCLNQLKTEKIRPEWRWSDLSEEQQRVLESVSAVEDPDIDGGMAAEVVNRLMDLLQPADRLVIRLLHLEEKSINEIAHITGWTVPVVKVRAFRARKKLQKHLQSLEPAMAAEFTPAPP